MRSKKWKTSEFIFNFILIFMEIMQNLFEHCSQAIGWLISQFQFFTGLSQVRATLVFWLIVGYIVVFVIIIPLHRMYKKKKLWLQKSLVIAVDEMIYLLAKTQHLKQLDLKALGWNPNVALMKSIFTKGNSDYIQGSFLILDNVHKVESLLWNKVIPAEKEAFFLKMIKKYHRISFFEAFFRSLAVIATFGVYLLFI